MELPQARALTEKAVHQRQHGPVCQTKVCGEISRDIHVD